MKPFCGKIKYLSNHIRDCESVQPKWKQKLELEENEGADSDNSATLTMATTSQAVSKKRQATFEVIPGAKRFKKDNQSVFESDILKFWTALNTSFNSIEHPFVRHFFEKWVPGAVIPGRDALSGRILDAEVLSIEAGRKSEMKDELATASVDGWSTKHDAVQQISCNIKGKVSYSTSAHSSCLFPHPGNSNSASHHDEGEKDVRQFAYPRHGGHHIFDRGTRHHPCRILLRLGRRLAGFTSTPAQCHALDPHNSLLGASGTCRTQP